LRGGGENSVKDDETRGTVPLGNAAAPTVKGRGGKMPPREKSQRWDREQTGRGGSRCSEKFWDHHQKPGTRKVPRVSFPGLGGGGHV